MRGDYLIPALAAHPWAMLESYVDTLADVLARHVDRVVLSADDLEARIGAAAPKPTEWSVSEGIAVLPLHGVISHRVNLLSQVSGGTSTEKFGQWIGAALRNPDVKGIALDVNSPGGSTYGLDELHRVLLDARGRKPLVAHVSPLAASAAYWIASAADQIVAEPGSDVGSVGVFALHHDQSAAEAKLGIKTTVIRSRKHKAEGNAHEPLSDETRKAIQERVDEADERFHTAVAVGRGLPRNAVEMGFGQGRLLTARAALKSGMIDAIQTRGEMLARLISRTRGGREAMH